MPTAKITKELYNALCVFSGIECFKGTFPLQVKEEAKLYQVPHRNVAYALEEQFRKELEHFQERK